MENLFDALPTAKEILEKRDSNKEVEIKKQIEFLLPELERIESERITVNFAVIQELRENLYTKGYNTIVNGNETIISIIYSKEDLFDEWTTYDCGN